MTFTWEHALRSSDHVVDLRRAAVYRWFAFTGRLLYVGCSVDPDKRWQDLQRTEGWTHLAAWRTLEWHESLPEARAAEREAIKTEDPLFNLQGLKGQGRKLIKRTLDMPDGTALPCWRFDSRWHIGPEAIERGLAHLRGGWKAAVVRRVAKEEASHS